MHQSRAPHSAKEQESEPPALAASSLEAPEREAAMGNLAAQDQLREQQEQDKPGSGSNEILDLSEPITHSKLEWCLDRIANQPGESGTLGFKFTAHANKGVGGLQARITGWLGLTIGYAMRDSNFSTMFIEGAGALRAGVDLGAFGSVGVSVGGQASVMEKWFVSTAAAASFLHSQLAELSHATEALEVEEPQGGQSDDDGAVFDVSSMEGRVGADAKGAVGKMKGGASVEAATRHNTFTDRDGETSQGSVTTLRTAAEIEVPIGGVNVRVAYNRSQGSVAGSPTMPEGGEFDRNEIDILLPFELLLKLAGKGIKAASPLGLRKQTAALADAIKHVVELCSKPLSKIVSRVPKSDKLEAGLFSSIANKLESSNMRSEVGIRLVWNDWATGGEMETMYTRALLYFNESMGYGMKSSLAGGVGVQLGYQRQTLLYEKLGTETLGYVERQYLFQTEDRPWSEFVTENDAALREIVANAATPGHAIHIEAVETEFERGDHAAGLTALERYWDRQKNLVAANRVKAEEVAEVADDALSLFTLRDTTREGAMKKVLAALNEVGDDPGRLSHRVRMIGLKGVSPADLMQLAHLTDRVAELKKLFEAGNIEVPAPEMSMGDDAAMFEPMGP